MIHYEQPAYADIYVSPIGELFIGASSDGLQYILFTDQVPELPTSYIPNKWTTLAVEWLDSYFLDQQEAHDIHLDISGTNFQIDVWHEIMNTPYGHTSTYLQLAKNLTNTSPRAVGAAVGANPLLLYIPCHRIIASNQKLQGYSGGLKRKNWLLAYESGDSLFLPDV